MSVLVHQQQKGGVQGAAFIFVVLETGYCLICGYQLKSSLPKMCNSSVERYCSVTMGNRHTGFFSPHLHAFLKSDCSAALWTSFISLIHILYVR